MPDRLLDPRLDPHVDVRDQSQGFMSLVSLAAGMAIVALIVLALYVLRDILMPLTLAALLSFVLAPMVSRLVKWKVPKGVAVPAVVLAAFTALGLLGYVFVNQVTQLAGELPSYQKTLSQKVIDLKGGAQGGVLRGAVDVVKGLVRELDTEPRTATPGPPAAAVAVAGAEALGQPATARPAKPVPVTVVEGDTPLAGLAALIQPLLHPLATTLMIVVFVAFILLQREDIRNRFVKLAGGRDLPRTTAALNDAAKRLSRLFATQLMLNSAFGVVIGVGLWLIGVPNALLWAVTAAVMRFVPYIGALISTVLPLTMALAVDPGWTMAILVVLLFLVVDPIIGHVIEPLLLGRTTGLSPVAVVVSATFWTWLWGPIGLILAIPLTVVLVVLGKHIEGLSFIDTLLGDEPALSETELFYQRMLAGDTLGTTAQIESVGERNGLLDYYDDVVISGLRMAQEDFDRGRLDLPRVRRMRMSVEEMFEGIDEDMLAASRTAALKQESEKRARAAQEAASAEEGGRAQDGKGAQKGKRKGEEESEDVGARPLVRLSPEDLDDDWRGETPVVVIGGRTALDDAAAEPLADALHRSGLGARALPAETLRGAGLADESMRGVRMAFLSFLDASADAPMRFAVRRLRVRMPQAKVVLCVWSDTAHTVDAGALAKATQADFVVTRVREAHQIATLAAVGGGLLDDMAAAPALTPVITPRAAQA